MLLLENLLLLCIAKYSFITHERNEYLAGVADEATFSEVTVASPESNKISTENMSIAHFILTATILRKNIAIESTWKKNQNFQWI